MPTARVADNADYGNAQTAVADAIEAQLFADSSGVGRARALYDMVSAGRFDRAAFTANDDFYFTPAMVAAYRSSLGPLGAPRGIEQTQSGLRGGFTIERFLVDFGIQKLEITFRAEPGARGRVEEFIVTPVS